MVPEAGEVQSDGPWLVQLFRVGDKPLDAARGRRPCRGPAEEGRDGQGGFLDAGFDAAVPAPAAIFGLARQQCGQGAMDPVRRRQRQLRQVAQGPQYPRRAIDGVGLVGRRVVAEPERQPDPVWRLAVLEVAQGHGGGFGEPSPQGGTDRRFPGRIGAEYMRCNVRATAVERQAAPTAAEGRGAAVAVGEVKQPGQARLSGAAVVRVLRPEPM